MKSLVLLLLVGVIAVAYCCEPGETKKEDCNTCNCANGNWACSKKACPSLNHYRRRRATCKDGETKMEACNACRCVNGEFACSRRACPPEGRSRRAAPTPENCTPGESFKYECNQCRCMNNGKGACTFRACP